MRRRGGAWLAFWLGAVASGCASSVANDAAEAPRSAASPPPGAPGAERRASARQMVGCAAGDRAAPVRARLEGKASYYHDSLAGNRTASGAIYRPNRLSAAHRRLPFGTRVRVTRLDVSPPVAVCVTVNDRGPFGDKRRIIDLSRRAAESLKMIRAGVVPVRVEVLAGK